jgi:hypothetical protein
MVLEFTQLLTEMSTRKLPGGKVWLALKADDVTAICELLVSKMWEPQHLKTLWACTACYRDSFTFLSYLNTDIKQRGSVHKIVSWN